ncbi:hypothetical protein LJ725_15100 [Reyranella aquatilis]|uniref:Transcriptional regulator n=1 Tax=Reyranella aquatilis TaxID=2035356 RepID=A0ABS8KW41_9HYPH|nr:hypothetical protein [Reyranella aquatilis]MCC8430301.1 hypothetical protein [Reyranella aquatilis]
MAAVRDFARKFDLVLKAFNLSRGRLAQTVGIDKSVVSRWASGATVPTDHNLSLLTHAVMRHKADFGRADWDLDVEAFAARLGVAAPERVAPSPAPPEKPSIAVLPFQNIGGDPEHEYFADGMTENTIALLSQSQAFTVIASSSSFSYKAGPSDPGRIAQQLNVRYLLEGTLRTAGNRVRVTAHLVDGRNLQRLWAGQFDRELVDVFAVQDDIASAIVGTLFPQLLNAEIRSQRQLQRPDLGAWGLVVRGLVALISFTRDNLAAAEENATGAIALAPDDALAYGVRAFARGYRAYTQWGEDWLSDARQAAADIKHALALDQDDPTGLFLVGGASMFMGRHRAGVGLLERAVMLNPNLAMARALLARGYGSLGQSHDGLPHVDQAMRLSPRDPMAYLFFGCRAFCHFAGGDFRDALASAESGLQLNEASVDNHLYMAAALAELDRPDDAARHVQLALRYAPGVRLATIANAIEQTNEGWKRYHAALAKAGLP